MTRAQFAAVLRQAGFSLGDYASAQPFTDISTSYWAANAIGSARTNGFLAGYPGNLFRPEQPITRSQVLISLANGLKYPASDPARLSKYRDFSEIPNYARTALAAADASYLIAPNGSTSQNHLYPNRTATRAEVATFVAQELTNRGYFPPVLMPSITWPTEIGGWV